MSRTGSVLGTGHASVSVRIAGLLPGWSPLEWTPGALPDHGSRLSLWEEELAEGPIEVVVSLVQVVLVDVTEDVGPEVSVRDIRAGIPVVGGINPGGGGNLGTALRVVVAVVWEWAR